MARSARDLLNLISFFQEKGSEVVSLKGNLDTSTPSGKMMLTVMAAISEFELEQLKEDYKWIMEAMKIIKESS